LLDGDFYSIIAVTHYATPLRGFASKKITSLPLKHTNKRSIQPKCSQTHVQAFATSKFTRGDAPGTQLVGDDERKGK